MAWPSAASRSSSCVPQFFYLIHQRVMQEVTRAAAPKRLVFRGLLAGNGALRAVGLNAGRILFSRVHRVLGGSMRILITGGSRFDPAIGADLFRLGFNILQAYGLTETSGAATLVRPGDSHIGSVGQVLPNTELKVLPPETADDEARTVRFWYVDRSSWPATSTGPTRRPRRSSGRLVPHGGSRADRHARPPDDYGAQEGNHRPQQRQEYLPRRDRGALPPVAFHQGTVRARPDAARRTERRTALRGRRAGYRGASREEGGEHGRPDPVRDGRLLRGARAAETGAGLRGVDGSAASDHNRQAEALRDRTACAAGRRDPRAGPSRSGERRGSSMGGPP